MELTGCADDYTQLRLEVTKTLNQIIKQYKTELLGADQDDIRILNEIESISRELSNLESTMSTYFLNGLLSEYTDFSKEISDAIHKLRSKGHGALIVIEKKDPVSSFLSGGTSILAQISSQLLESLFNPESLLHNGAVFIKSDLIISAANGLPLTEQIFWDRYYDKRELSAVGLTERCDALALLVSETRTISFCFDGHLYTVSSK